MCIYNATSSYTIMRRSVISPLEPGMIHVTITTEFLITH